MNNNLKKKIVLQGPYEDVIKENNHFYIVDKFFKICVLPYTISQNGILNSIGVIKKLNVLEEKENYHLISDYITSDDPTNLVAANRILFEIIGSNVTKADEWMYLGNLNNVSVGSKMMIYAVNITDVDINESEEIEESKKVSKFEIVDSNKIVSSDDALFLAAYLRLFNYFYVNSIKI